VGTAGRRRRDCPDQRTAGEQAESRRLRPVPQGVRAGRQAAHGRRSAGRQSAAARAATETEEAGTAVVRPVHGRCREASIPTDIIMREIKKTRYFCT